MYVAWTDTRNGATDIYLNYSTDLGATWQVTDVRLDTDPPGSALSQSCDVICTADTVVVAWVDFRNQVFPTPSVNIVCNRSLDGGATWLTSDIALSDQTPSTSGPVRPFGLAATGLRVHVITEADSGVFMRTSEDGGTTWPAPVTISPPRTAFGARTIAPRVAIDDSTVHAAWFSTDSWSGDIFANHSDDAGQTWQPADDRLNSASINTAVPASVELSAIDGFAHVVWTEERGGIFDRDVFAARSADSGDSWLAEVQLTAEPPSFLNVPLPPEVAVDEAALLVVWEENLSEIFGNYSQDRGATWHGEFQVNSTPLSSDRALRGAPRSVIVDGLAHVVWKNEGGIYFTSIALGCREVGGGCEGAGTPSCVGYPSSSASFSIECPPSVHGCQGPSTVVFGSGAIQQIQVPPPIGCGPCGFVIESSFGATVGALDVGPGLVPGFQFSTQCGCLSFVGAPCVELSRGLVVFVGL
ncbi:MAG: exo-alpha-sialidase [Planctomycetes bacterium]|nr:exo-alpha-sialidase [Planctomycetota bacterium]